MLGRRRRIAHWPWNGQATHAVAGQLEQVVGVSTARSLCDDWIGYHNDVSIFEVIVVRPKVYRPIVELLKR